MSVKFNDKVFCKMVAHSIKYPHCTVNGILLGKSLGGSKNAEFLDAIPLSHLCINLIPTAEIALMQIDEYASRKGLSIIGYYVSPENAKDNNFEKIHNRIIEKIALNSSPCYVVIVGSTIANIQMGNVSLKVAQYADGNYKQCDASKVSDSAINMSMNLLEDNVFERIVDFDNHFDNIRLDWTNAEFNSLISA